MLCLLDARLAEHQLNDPNVDAIGEQSARAFMLVRPRKILFARPRLKIRARPAHLRMNERDETEGGYRGDNARSCADQRFVPTLTVDDLQKSITFYEALGFVIDERWKRRDAARRDAASGQDPDRPEPGRLGEGARPQEGIGVRLSISTTPGNVDEIAKRARNAGITLKSDPHDTEWKSRAFEVSDPSGFLLTIFSETSA